MKKVSTYSWALFLLLAACEGDGDSDVIAVRGEVSAVLSGDGMPADERQTSFEHNEMWLDLDETDVLHGFRSHPWDLEPREHTYDLDLKFAPATAPGKPELLEASVCFVSCGDRPDRDGCSGPCFNELLSGEVDVRSVSEDGRSFELSFEFEVADHEGRTIKVSGGEARTRD